MVPKQPPLQAQAQTPRIGPAQVPTPLPEQQALLTQPMNRPPAQSSRRRLPLQPAKLPVQV
jgi:hypothetical protein